MAKYIEVKQLGMFTYALDECEDYVLLDAYLRIRQSGRFDDARYLKTFEYYHLQEGGTLNDNILLQLNGSLRQLGRPSLAFVNGHTTSFAGLRGQEKVMRRQAILEHVRSLDVGHREALLVQKREEAARLPERSGELPVRAPDGALGLKRAEVERRREAVSRSQQAEVQRSGVGEAGAAEGMAPGAGVVVAEVGEPEFVPVSTVQDNVVGLIDDMQELKTELASLKAMLQAIFRNV